MQQVMDRVFSFLLWPKHGAHGPWKQGRKKRESITCRTDRANEANKMFIIWLWWLWFWKGDVDWRARGPYGYLRTWNWPITARKISQPYNNVLYRTVLYCTLSHALKNTANQRPGLPLHILRYATSTMQRVICNGWYSTLLSCHFLHVIVF